MTEILHHSVTSKRRPRGTAYHLIGRRLRLRFRKPEPGGVCGESGGGHPAGISYRALHIDGKANINGAGDHSAEPFPATAPKASGGFIVKPPDPKGEWSVRAFAFHPAQVVVRQGDTVVLNFMGVQGPSHTIAIAGQRERLSLKRGEMKTVRFVAEQPGEIRYISVGREPTMQGSVVVLPSK